MSLHGPESQRLIHLDEPGDLAYWTQMLGCSEDELHEIVGLVGPHAIDVRCHLGRMRYAQWQRESGRSRDMRRSRRRAVGLGVLIALAVALSVTVAVLAAPQHLWGPKMWPLYVIVSGVLLWIAVDLRRKLHDRPAAASEAPAWTDAVADPADTDMLVHDATECPICLGARWVCEDHPKKPWHHDGCDGAGLPCACNPYGALEWREIDVAEPGRSRRDHG